jgi:DNA-binding transcriptional LysR family regulator
MAVINRFLADKPGVEIDICEEVLGGAWEALIDDRVQLAIGAPAPKPSGQGIRAEPLGVLERVFAVAADHPLTRLPQPLRETDISQHRLVIVHDSSRTGIPRATRLLNLDRHFYVQTIPQKLEAQRAGIGVGFLPRRMVEPLVAAGEMAVLEVAEVNLEDHLFLAWKVANRGQGLKLLTRLLLETDFRFD